MANNADELIKRGDRLFSARTSFLNLCQELADQFYPERADFTGQRMDGDIFADHLLTSEPIMMSRELAAAFSWLRAQERDWFELTVDGELKDPAAKLWLERGTKTMRRVLYRRQACFNRAMKEGERDWAVFGNVV